MVLFVLFFFSPGVVNRFWKYSTNEESSATWKEFLKPRVFNFVSRISANETIFNQCSQLLFFFNLQKGFRRKGNHLEIHI